MDLAGGGCLDLDDPTADFEFVPAMTPKGKGSRAAPAFAPSPVREEPEEEEEQEAMVTEEAMEEDPPIRVVARISPPAVNSNDAIS